MTAPLEERVTVNPLIRALAHLWLLPRRWRLRRTKLNRTVIERIAGLPLVITPQVMNPNIFRTGRYFAEVLAKMDPPTGPARALDVGTGCGVLALVAASLGYQAVGVDTNPEAVQCARINALLNDMADRVEIRQGDLFAPVAGERFDLVLCSLPKFRGQPDGLFDQSWRGQDVIERFAAGLPDMLTPTGAALVLLTTHGDDEGMLAALKSHGLLIHPVARKHFGVEIFTIYKVT